MDLLADLRLQMFESLLLRHVRLPVPVRLGQRTARRGYAAPVLQQSQRGQRVLLDGELAALLQCVLK